MPDNTQHPQRKAILMPIAIALIWPNPENPRSYTDPEAVKTLAANMKATGQRTPVKLVLLTEEDRTIIIAQQGTCPYDYKLLGGHMRREAALALGWDTLDALILDLSPDEAELEMILDNQVTELPWLDRYKIIERQVNTHPGVFQSAIAERLGVAQSDVSRALKTLKYLNPASRELIYAARIRNGAGIDGGKTITLALTALENSEKVEKALKVAFDLKLIEAQAKNLVKWVNDGHSAETFDPRDAKAPQTPKAKSVKALVEASQTSSPAAPGPQTALEGETHLANHAGLPTPSGLRETNKTMNSGDASSSMGIPLRGQTGTTKTSASAGGHPHKSSEGQVGTGETLVWDTLAGVSVISQIKAKVKKGQRPSLVEALLLIGHYLGRGLGWLSEHGFKLIGHILKWIGKLFLDALKSTAKMFGKTFYNVARLMVILAILGGIAWLGWDIYQHGLFHPLRVIESRFQSPVKIQPLVAAPAVAPQPQTVSAAEVKPPAAVVTQSPTPQPKVMEAAASSEVSVSQPMVSVQPASPLAQAHPTVLPVGTGQQTASQPAPTPTVHDDMVEKIADSTAKQVGADVAGDVAKKLFNF